MLFISAHPTILNGKSAVLSADLIGHVRQRLERKYGCPVLCVNGTCGDVSTRFYRQGEGVAELERTANELCAQIESKRERAALRVDTPRWGSISMKSVYDAKTDPDWIEMTNRIEAMDASPMRDFLLKRQQLKLSMGKIELELPSQFAVIGNCIFITMPCDTCSTLGLDFKRAFSNTTSLLSAMRTRTATTLCLRKTTASILKPTTRERRAGLPMRSLRESFRRSVPRYSGRYRPSW